MNWEAKIQAIEPARLTGDTVHYQGRNRKVLATRWRKRGEVVYQQVRLQIHTYKKWINATGVRDADT